MTAEIEALRADNEWLGAQEGKIYPRDRGGSFARYKHGDIYHHPGLGTYIISEEFRSAWGHLRYESGWLGYPTGESDGFVQRFEHGWLTRKDSDSPVFATWINPDTYGMPIEEAVGLPNGWIIQRFEGGKYARCPKGSITRYEHDELTPPEIEYRNRPRYFPTLAQKQEQWAHPPKPEPEPEPEYADGLDYDPDDIPEY